MGSTVKHQNSDVFKTTDKINNSLTKETEAEDVWENAESDDLWGEKCGGTCNDSVSVQKSFHLGSPDTEVEPEDEDVFCSEPHNVGSHIIDIRSPEVNVTHYFAEKETLAPSVASFEAMMKDASHHDDTPQSARVNMAPCLAEKDFFRQSEAYLGDVIAEPVENETLVEMEMASCLAEGELALPVEANPQAVAADALQNDTTESSEVDVTSNPAKEEAVSSAGAGNDAVTVVDSSTLESLEVEVTSADDLSFPSDHEAPRGETGGDGAFKISEISPRKYDGNDIQDAGAVFQAGIGPLAVSDWDVMPPETSSGLDRSYLDRLSEERGHQTRLGWHGAFTRKYQPTKAGHMSSNAGFAGQKVRRGDNGERSASSSLPNTLGIALVGDPDPGPLRDDVRTVELENHKLVRHGPPSASDSRRSSQGQDAAESSGTMNVWMEPVDHDHIPACTYGGSGGTGAPSPMVTRLQPLPFAPARTMSVVAATISHLWQTANAMPADSDEFQMWLKDFGQGFYTDDDALLPDTRASNGLPSALDAFKSGSAREASVEEHMLTNYGGDVQQQPAEQKQQQQDKLATLRRPPQRAQKDSVRRSSHSSGMHRNVSESVSKTAASKPEQRSAQPRRARDDATSLLRSVVDGSARNRANRELAYDTLADDWEPTSVGNGEALDAVAVPTSNGAGPLLPHGSSTRLSEPGRSTQQRIKAQREAHAPRLQASMGHKPPAQASGFGHGYGQAYSHGQYASLDGGFTNTVEYEHGLNGLFN